MEAEVYDKLTHNDDFLCAYPDDMQGRTGNPGRWMHPAITDVLWEGFSTGHGRGKFGPAQGLSIFRETVPGKVIYYVAAALLYRLEAAKASVAVNTKRWEMDTGEGKGWIEV